MSDDAEKLQLVSVRLSKEEVALLAEVQAQIAKPTNNPDVKVTQRTAVVTALRFFLHEKTRPKRGQQS